MIVHCYLARDGKFETRKELCFDKDVSGVKPATKEQRDTLEKVMTDAGYTFNFEKKELKEIEQKSAWSEEDEKIYQSIMDDFVQENQLDEKQIDWIRDIKYRDFSQPQKQWKPSQEQIDALKRTVHQMKKSSFYNPPLEHLYQDLKELKE